MKRARELCFLAAVAAIGVAAGMGCQDDGDDCAVGSVGCSCAFADTCDPGLQCLSSICVAPGAPDAAAPGTAGGGGLPGTGGAGGNPITDGSAGGNPDGGALADAACQVGAEACACTPGGGCDPGLACMVNVCTKAGGQGGAGGTAGTGGSGGTGGTPPPAARVKFCHELALANQPVVITAVIGEGAAARSVSANTLSCSSPLGQPCATVPTGEKVPIVLRAGGEVLWEGTADRINPGEEWILFASFDDEIVVEGFPLPSGQMCATANPFD